MVSDKGPYGGVTCLANDDVRESLAGETVEPPHYLADPVRVTHPRTPPTIRRRSKFIQESEAPAWVDPPWLQPTVQALEELLMLPAGWDSYGARPVDPQHALAMVHMLYGIMRDTSPAPSVVPTNRGGVQVEWHRGGIDLEIETLSPHRFLVSYEDADSEWEAEIISDWTRLGPVISRLS